MLTTGEEVTLITWPVILVTRSYMHENGGEAPGQDAVGASWRKRRLRYAICQCLSHGFPISYVVDRLLNRVLSEQVRGRVVENRPSASRSAFSYSFPE